MKLSYCFILFFLFSCKEPIALERRTSATGQEPYVVSIVDPLGPADFYHRLHDSLNQHIRSINGYGLLITSNSEAKKEDFYGWLQDQFDDDFSGLGLKAAAADKRDRTSDEHELKTPEGTDKISFTADFRVDSIPREFLYPAEWKKAIAASDHSNAIQNERAKFGKSGGLIRKQGNVSDTLFVYSYSIPVDITLNYFLSKEKKWTSSSFTLPVVAAVYHQLRFR